MSTCLFGEAEEREGGMGGACFQRGLRVCTPRLCREVGSDLAAVEACTGRVSA